MAGLSLYEVTVPTYIRGHLMLKVILTKAEEHAKEKGLDADAEYPGARIIDDMLPLTRQVQIASDMAKKAVVRITGEEIEAWADEEKTMAELHARVRKTLDLLKSVDPAKINGLEANVIKVPIGKGNLTDMSTKDYVFNMNMPQFYFHIQTAYCILRMKGVLLGKANFLTEFLYPTE